MAIADDILDAWADLIGTALYPNGVDDGEGNELPSTANHPVLVYAGWPVPDQLTKDIRNGITHINIYMRPEERIGNTQPGPWKMKSVSQDGLTGTAERVLRSQEQLIQVEVWSPSRDIRSAVFRVVDSLFANRPRVLLPDDTWAGVTHRNTMTDDDTQKAGIYRKGLYQWVRYDTVEVKTFSTITDTIVNISGSVPPGEVKYDDGKNVVYG